MADNNKPRFTLGSIAGQFIGAQTARNTVTAVWKIQKNFGSAIYNAFVDGFSSWQPDWEIPVDIQDPVERFQYALDASGNRSVLPQMVKNAQVRTQFWFIAFFVMFTLGLATMKRDGVISQLVAGNAYYFPGVILPLSIAIIFLTKMVKWSFWSFQMRHLRLDGLSAWLKKPREWLPPDVPGGRIAQMIITGSVGTLLLQTGMGHAIAQTVSNGSDLASSSVVSSLMGSLPQGDLSMQWMENLFPSFFSSQTGVSFANDAVAQMFQAINTALVAIGSVVLGYHAVTGIAATAHDGEALGKKWHTMWSTIRVGLGSASVIPVNGYCAAQIIAIKIILAGLGLANLTWQAYVTSATGNGGQAMVAVTIPPQAMDDPNGFQDVMQSAVCLKDAEWYFRPTGSTTSLAVKQLPQASFNGTPVANFADPTTSGGATSGSWNFGAACGEVSFPSLDLMVASQTGSMAAARTGKLNIAPPSSGQVDSENQAATTFANARNSAFNTFVTTVMSSTYVNNIAGGNVPGSSINLSTLGSGGLTSELQEDESAYITYENAVITAASIYMSSMNSTALANIQTEATDLGWASAGAIEPQILAVGAKVDQTAEQTVDYTAGTPGDAGPDFVSQVYDKTAPILKTGEQEMVFGSPNTATSQIASTGMTESQAAMAISGDPTNFTSVVGTYSGSIIEKAMINLTEENSLSPIAQISGEGTVIKSVGYAIEGLYLGMAGTTKGAEDAADDVPYAGAPVAGIAGFAAGVAQALAPQVGPLAVWLIIIGLFMQIIVPMIGYVVWICAILGYIIFAVELVVGASFAGFAHISAEGDELVGQKQSYGYGVLLVALFYPVLLVTGLIFANLILSVSVELVNSTFLMSTNGIGTLYDPFAIILVCALQSYIYFQLIIRSYRTISYIPEWTSAYFGVNVNSRRDDSHGTAAGIIQNSNTKLERAATQGGGAIGGVMRKAPAGGTGKAGKIQGEGKAPDGGDEQPIET